MGGQPLGEGLPPLGRREGSPPTRDGHAGGHYTRADSLRSFRDNQVQEWVNEWPVPDVNLTFGSGLWDRHQDLPGLRRGGANQGLYRGSRRHREDPVPPRCERGCARSQQVAARPSATPAGVEWALSDAHHDRLVVMPRRTQFTALTPDGSNGMSWRGTYGYVSITAYGQDYGPDGLNEQGLYVGMYYFPGFASHHPFDPTQAHRTLSVGDFMRWMLSSFASVDEVLSALAHPDAPLVVRVDDPRFGGAPLPFHWKITDATGAARVFEFLDNGVLHVHEPVAGVITNSPTYDWHVTNLRAHLGLTQAAAPAVKIGNTTLTGDRVAAKVLAILDGVAANGHSLSGLMAL